MIGITERIKNILTEYAGNYNNAATERDRLKAENSAKYLPQVASVENEKVDEAFNNSIAPIKVKALEDAKDVLRTARLYIRIRIQDVDTEALMEINALRDMELSETEIAVLKGKYQGSYWSLRALSERFESKTGEALTDNLHNVKSFKPEPDIYFAIFDEIEQEVKKFIECYAGSNAITSTNAEAVYSQLLLSGSWFEEIEERLNYNSDFFISYAPWHGLTQEEQEKIRKEEERKKLIDKAMEQQRKEEAEKKEQEEWEKKYSGKYHKFY